MIKIGLIGNLGSIVTHIGQLKNIKDIQLIGKSSVGMMEEPQGKYLSIPECNRQELVETADFLIVENSNLLLPDLLKVAIKKNKHLYITDFPEISPELCFELLKLADEARTMVHIYNYPGSESFTNWLNENWKEPAYLSLFESLPALPGKLPYLTKYLLFALSLFKSQPQKIRVSGIHQPDSDYYFINVRLDFPSYSTFNLEMLIQPNGSHNIKIALPGKFLTGDFTTSKATLNQKEIILPSSRYNPVVELLQKHGREDFLAASNLNMYYFTLLTLRDVIRKIELFTPWK
jgi:hypothetical protein